MVHDQRYMVYTKYFFGRAPTTPFIGPSTVHEYIGVLFFFARCSGRDNLQYTYYRLRSDRGKINTYIHIKKKKNLRRTEDGHVVNDVRLEGGYSVLLFYSCHLPYRVRVEEEKQRDR